MLSVSEVSRSTDLQIKSSTLYGDASARPQHDGCK
jgi:hypothetical protein